MYELQAVALIGEVLVQVLMINNTPLTCKRISFGVGYIVYLSFVLVLCCFYTGS